ncbi:MAG: GlmU family protein [Chitinophagales bacterium]|nr:GlmU family protein [Chitinophagales bacterium]MDW8427608.1 GlmU family protein [Chitinophagales bacterium]
MEERNYILFDDDCRTHLLPLTFTRPVAELRVGILTIKEKWQRSLNCSLSYLTEEYLAVKFPPVVKEINWLINGSVLPNPRMVAQVAALKCGDVLADDQLLIAACLRGDQVQYPLDVSRLLNEGNRISPVVPPRTIRKLTDIITLNEEALRDDYKMLTYRRRSAPIYESNKVLNRNDVFIEEGAKVEFAFLNASKGPIYIGKGVEIMEGAMIRGPAAFGEGSIVKMGAKIYGPTSIGPRCVVGGEINSSVMIGFSNKAHDGFLGHAVIGEWCNLGADSNNSNLKNDYGEVKIWNYATQSFVRTGLQFFGLIMGDHSKCGINTMFNTGTIVGVFVNVFGAAFPRNFIPSFSWGGASGFTEYRIDKAIEVAKRVMARRQVELSAADEAILRHIASLPIK